MEMEVRGVVEVELEMEGETKGVLKWVVMVNV